jgi:hypothetical protein
MYEENYDDILMSHEQLFAFVDDAKLRQEYHRNKKTADFFIDLLRQEPGFATKCR